MKRIVLILFLAPLIYAQGEMVKTFQGSGLFASDSLYNTYIDTSATPDDTLFAEQTYVMLEFNFEYEFATIAYEDTQATYDDSVWVEYAIPHYTRISDKVYTLDSITWKPVQFIKDADWEQAAMPLVDDDSFNAYTVYVGDYWKIRVRWEQVEAVLNRAGYVHIQAAKKK